MKRFLIIIQLLLLQATVLLPVVSAQNEATKILDKAAAAFQNAGGVKAEYTFTVEGESSHGVIKMKGQSFVNTFDDHVIWFDGKTLWTLVKSNEEVNITTPSQREVAKMNPYAFVSIYKKGYTAKQTGKGSKDVYEIELTANADNKSSVKSILLRLARSNYEPRFVRMKTADGATTEITVKSFVKGQKYGSSTFQFNPKNYPDVDIVDLR